MSHVLHNYHRKSSDWTHVETAVVWWSFFMSRGKVTDGRERIVCQWGKRAGGGGLGVRVYTRRISVHVCWCSVLPVGSLSGFYRPCVGPTRLQTPSADPF